MKYEVYSIYDSKVKAYLPPFQLRNTGEAIRAFMGIANNPESNISKYPEDFSLMHIASYNDEKGTYTNIAVPINLGLATTFIKPANLEDQHYREHLAKQNKDKQQRYRDKQKVTEIQESTGNQT